MSCFICNTVPVEPFQCGRCYNVIYCSEECQVQDWHKGHRVVCQKAQQKTRDWNSRLMDYAKEMDNFVSKLAYPTKAKTEKEWVRQMDSQLTRLDEAIDKTKSLSYSMMKARGASQKQMDYIENQTREFETKMQLVVNSGLRGKDDISIKVVQEMQQHLDNAQTTINVISGTTVDREKQKKMEEELIVEEIVKIVSHAGEMLSETLLREKRSNTPLQSVIVPVKNSIVPIPKRIGGNFGDWAHSIPPYVAGKVSNIFGDLVRDIIHCMGSTKDMTYSSSARMLSSSDRLEEHTRAVAHAKENLYLGPIMLKVAELLDDSHKIFENAALGPEQRTKEYEKNRQTASMLFSIALATGLGIYSVMCYTDLGNYKDLKTAEKLALEQTKAEQQKNETIAKDLRNYWKREEKRFNGLYDKSIEVERQIERRQSFVGSIEGRDIAFDKLLESAIYFKTGCNITTSDSGTALQEIKAPSNTPPPLEGLNQDMRALVRKVFDSDRQISSTQKHSDPGPLHVVDRREDIIVDEKKCDVGEIMPAFNSLFSTMFAEAERSLKSMPKRPEVTQSFFEDSQKMALDNLEKQRIMLTNAIDGTNKIGERAETLPAAAVAHFKTLNDVNPLLAQGFLSAVQKVQQQEGEKQERITNTYKSLATGCAFVAQQRNTTRTQMRTAVLASEKSIAGIQAEISGIIIPEDPVNFAMGTIVWIINKVFTLGTSSQKQFAGAFIPAISSAYTAMLSMAGKVSITGSESWEIFFSSLSAFLSKLFILLWWLDIGLVGIAVASTAVLLLFATPVVKILRLIGERIGRFFTSSAPNEFKNLPKNKFARDEGSAINSSLIGWLFGGGGIFDTATFSVGNFFNGLIFGSSVITFTSLLISMFASFCTALANVVTIAITNGWQVVGVAFRNVAELATGVILILPLYRFIWKRTDYDDWFCFRRLMLLLGGFVNLTGLANQKWSMEVKLIFTTFELFDYTPSWEVSAWMLYMLYRKFVPSTSTEAKKKRK